MTPRTLLLLCSLLVLPLGSPSRLQAGETKWTVPRSAQLTSPLKGVKEIREPLRELRSLRHRLLETSVHRRYAIGGRLELLVVDAPSIWQRQIDWLQRYRLLVADLLEIPVKMFLEDPGTRAALIRAIRWGRQTAIAMPRLHRKGYLKIQPILDGEVSTDRIVGFGLEG